LGCGSEIRVDESVCSSGGGVGLELSFSAISERERERVVCEVSRVWE
jgi:vacuolar-type H+-ATPase subunit E/Vma4